MVAYLHARLTRKRCSSGHVIRPGTPAQRRLGVLPYAGFMSSVTVQVLGDLLSVLLLASPNNMIMLLTRKVATKLKTNVAVTE